MARTSVSRRLVYIKKTKNPVAPLPKQAPSGDATASKAASAAVFAAPAARPSARASGATTFTKFAAIFVGAACAGGAVAVMSNNELGTSRDYVEPAARPVVVRPAASRTIVAGSGAPEHGLSAVLAKRSAPTDESFRASAYARRR